MPVLEGFTYIKRERNNYKFSYGCFVLLQELGSGAPFNLGGQGYF